ncbi:glycoside hydrolase family 68 protein [Streptomyces sp. CG4]|uniref:glycoside hydrolase family 68 protein n=1 Tax=Streptomyces sp. CG4 TaxID=408783 RepID=UPI0034E1FF05
MWFSGFQDHRIIAQADGKLYQTLEQSQEGPIIYAFRDPFVFRDPRDRKVHLLAGPASAVSSPARSCCPCGATGPGSPTSWTTASSRNPLSVEPLRQETQLVTYREPGGRGKSGQRRPPRSAERGRR